MGKKTSFDDHMKVIENGSTAKTASLEELFNNLTH